MESDPPQLDCLVIVSHPDDAEISSGGTIIRLKRLGYRVGVIDLTDGEPTPHGTREIRAKETEIATQILGIDFRCNLGLPNRSLIHDLESRALLAGWIRRLRPNLLITHHWDDAHPDHVAASALVDAARFWAKLSKTDLPGSPHHPKKVLYCGSIHLKLHQSPQLIVDISDCLGQKLEACRAYHSQLVQGRGTSFPTVIDDLETHARHWGWAIGAQYGEAFFSREAIGLAHPMQLFGLDSAKLGNL